MSSSDTNTTSTPDYSDARSELSLSDDSVSGDVDLDRADLDELASSIMNQQVGNPIWDGAPDNFDKIKAWVDKQGSSSLIARGLALFLWGGVIPCLESKHQSQAQIRGCIINNGICIKATHASLGDLASTAPQQKSVPYLGLRNKHRAALDASQIMSLNDMEHIFNGFTGHYDRVCLEKDHSGPHPQTDTSFTVFNGPLCGHYRTIAEIAAQLEHIDDELDSVTVTATLASVCGSESTLLARRCCIENTEDLLFSWTGLDRDRYQSMVRPLAHLGDSASWVMQRVDLSSGQDIYKIHSCNGFHGMLNQSDRPEFFDSPEDHGSLWRHAHGLSAHEEAYVAGKDTIASMLGNTRKDACSWHSTICCSPEFLKDLAEAEVELSMAEEFESHTNCSFYEIHSHDYTNFLSGVIDRYYIGMDWARASYTSLSRTLAPVYQSLFLCLLDFLDIDNSYHDYVYEGRSAGLQRALGLGFGEAIQAHGFSFLDQVVWYGRPERSPYLREEVRLPWPIKVSNRGLFTAETNSSSWRENMLRHMRVVGALVSKHGPESEYRRLFDVLVYQVVHFLLRSWRVHIGELLLTRYPKRDPSGVSSSLKQKREAYIRQDIIRYDNTFIPMMEQKLGFPINSFVFSQRRRLAAQSVDSLAEFWWEYKVPSTWAQNEFKPKKAQHAEDFAIFCGKIAELENLHCSVHDFKQSLYTRFWEYHDVFPHPETNHKSLITTATNQKGINQPRLLMAITFNGKTNSLTAMPEPSRVVPNYPLLYDESGITTLVGYILPEMRDKRRGSVDKSSDLLLKRRRQ